MPQEGNMDGSPGASWHPDPTGRHELRYWDGAAWTEHVCDASVQSADPLELMPQGGASTPSGDGATKKPGLLNRAASALKGSPRQLTPAEVALRQAELGHASSVKAAQKDLKSVKKTSGKAIKEAENSLKTARAHGTAKLGGYGGVVAFEHSVQTPQGTINLESEQATAAVDTAGALMETRRSTLTRMAAGGILLGPVGLIGGGMMKKKGAHDTRELYLVVESGSVASIVECKPDDGVKVRKLATVINNAARGAADRAAHRAQLVAQATQQLAAARQKRDAAVAEAEATLKRAEEDTAEIEAARARTALDGGNAQHV